MGKSKFFKMLAFVLSVVIISGVTAFTTTYIFIEVKGVNKDTAVTDSPVVVESAVTGNQSTVDLGGDRSMILSDGTVLKFNVPDNMYDITAVYLDVLTTSTGASTPIVANNTIITGNAATISESVDSINASTFSDIYNMYVQMYGEEFMSGGIESVHTPTYTYMTTGSLPADLDASYSIKEEATYKVGDVTYKAYSVSYDTDTTQYYAEDGSLLPEDEVVPTSVNTSFLAVYSDTEDAVEIMIYERENNLDNQLRMLREFIGYTE